MSRARKTIGSLLALSLTCCQQQPVSAFLYNRVAHRDAGIRTSSGRSLHRLKVISKDIGARGIPPETVSLVSDFVGTVQQSLEDETFVSLLLRGPPPVSKKQKAQRNAKERMRGCIRQVQGRLISLRKQTLLQITIKYHGATDVAKNYSVDQVKSALTCLLLSDSNVVASEWGENAIYPCGAELGIQRGELQTTSGIWDFAALASKPCTLKFREADVSTATPMLHDRSKKVPLSSKSSFLQALGLTKPDGKPRPTMSSKLKQCQKFVEIVSGLVESCIASRKGVSTISTVDMGCGRGYLTFSLHSYLNEKYGSDATVQSCGIDVRPKLVKEISEIASSLGSGFEGLSFQEGTIEDAVSQPQEKQAESLDVLIALHACDTATDDALWSGIQSGSDVLVVAPCCHKEVRRQLDRYFSNEKNNHPLADLLRHKIYRERIAETVTDSLRALLLEIANYNVQVFEFIGGEHTGKNVMITAVKRQRSRGKNELMGLRERLMSLAALHGVKEHRLAKWMDETLTLENDEPRQRILSSREMPPI